MSEAPPPGSIVITPKEFYDGVRDDISAIKQAVAPLTDVVTRVEVHERRITQLERLSWVALGVALASGGTGIVSLFH